MNQEKGCLPRLLRLLAIAVTVSVVAALPLTLVAYDIGQVIFSQEKMTQIIGDQVGSSSGLRRLLVEGFLSNPAPEGATPNEFNLARAAESLSPEQTQELSDLLLPEEWFRQQVESIVGGVYTWLDGDQPRPKLDLDLRPLKERLLSGGAKQLMLLLIESWPECLSDQVAQIEKAVRSTGPPPILYCKPPSSLRGVYNEKSTIWFTNQVRAMPDSIPLTGERGGPQQGQDLIALRDRLLMARGLLRNAWMVPASLFGLIMALAIRSWLGVTRWWGAPLAGTGLVSLLLIPFARPLEAGLLRGTRPGEALPPILMEILGNASGSIRSAVVRALAAQAILLLLVGAALLLGGWLWARRRRTSGVPESVRQPHAEPSGLAEEATDRPSGIFG